MKIEVSDYSPKRDEYLPEHSISIDGCLTVRLQPGESFTITADFANNLLMNSGTLDDLGTLENLINGQAGLKINGNKEIEVVKRFYKHPEFEFDRVQRNLNVYMKERECTLSNREASLLWLCCENENELLAYEKQLHDWALGHVGKPHDPKEVRKYIRTMTSNLRKKLTQPPFSGPLRTIWDKGIMLVNPDSPSYEEAMNGLRPVKKD